MKRQTSKGKRQKLKPRQVATPKAKIKKQRSKSKGPIGQQPEKHAGGRPEIEYDPVKHPKLMLYLRRKKDMTNEKIAELMGVSHDTLLRWREKHPGFCVAYDTALLDVKAELTDSAYNCANGFSKMRKSYMVGAGPVEIEEYYPPNPTMLKFLAVNVLEMADTHQITTPPGQPIQVENVPNASEKDMRKVVAAAEKIVGKKGA